MESSCPLGDAVSHRGRHRLGRLGGRRSLRGDGNSLLGHALGPAMPHPCLGPQRGSEQPACPWSCVLPPKPYLPQAPPSRRGQAAIQVTGSPPSAGGSKRPLAWIRVASFPAGWHRPWRSRLAGLPPAVTSRTAMTRSLPAALGWKGPSWAERAGMSTEPAGEPVAEQGRVLLAALKPTRPQPPAAGGDPGRHPAPWPETSLVTLRGEDVP